MDRREFVSELSAATVVVGFDLLHRRWIVQAQVQ